MAYIEIQSGSKSYQGKDGECTAFSGIDLAIEKGELICFLGPSGCGKSSLLNTLAGFETLTQGSIQIDGVKVNKPNPKYVMIFQNYGLLPWRTVLGNVELGLEVEGMPVKQRRDLALGYLKMVGLEKFKESFPRQLSGGMRQRVAIARALAVNPDILFMDEPFGALDAITRMKLQEDILRICQDEQKTILFVTHDIEEATYLADRVVVLDANPGRIKAIVKVPMGHYRDRTSGDFLLVRDRLFDLLRVKKQVAIEYNI